MKPLQIYHCLIISPERYLSRGHSRSHGQTSDLLIENSVVENNYIM